VRNQLRGKSTVPLVPEYSVRPIVIIGFTGNMMKPRRDFTHNPTLVE